MQAIGRCQCLNLIDFVSGLGFDSGLQELFLTPGETNSLAESAERLV
jgi:hypothetical protein